MPRLNDLTDINMTGLKVGAASNWTKFTISDFNIRDYIIVTSSDVKFNTNSYDSTNDGKTFTVVAGLDSTDFTRFLRLSLSSTTPEKCFLEATDLNFGITSETQSIKQITSAVCSSASTNGTYYYTFRRNSSTTNDSYSSSGTHNWPTLGIISDVYGTPSNSIKDLIVDGSSNEYKVALLQEKYSGIISEKGKTVCVSEDGSKIVIIAMPLNSTTEYKLLVSSDGGTNWSLSDANSLNTGGVQYSTVIYARDCFYSFYVTGSAGSWTYNIIKSTDGLSWTSVSSLSGQNAYFTELHHVAGVFILSDTYSMNYKRSSNLVDWSSIYNLDDGSSDADSNKNYFLSFENAGLFYSPYTKQTIFTKNLEINFSNKPKQDIGWQADGKNKQKTKSASDFFPQIFYHSGKVGGTFYRGYYLLDTATTQFNSGMTIVAYVNTTLADVVPPITAFTERFSSWKSVTKVGGNGGIYEQIISRQNKFSNEFVGHGILRTFDGNFQYRTFASSDLLNWNSVTGGGVTSGAPSLYEPNQTNASWGVICPSENTYGSFKVSSTGLTGTFTAATLPDTIRMSYNGMVGHAVGVGDTWLVAVKNRANSIQTIIYSTDGGATFSLLPGVPTNNTDRPWAVGYANGYWMYWRRNGSTGTGIYYSTDLVNWTQNTSVPVGGYTRMEVSYINGRYVFGDWSGLGTVTSNSDITATSGWTTASFANHTGYDNNTFVSSYGEQAYLAVTVRDGSSFNGSTPSDVVNPTDDLIEHMGQGYKAYSDNIYDNGYDTYSRPFYLNGYWYTISKNGMVYRNLHSRLI